MSVPVAPADSPVAADPIGDVSSTDFDAVFDGFPDDQFEEGDSPSPAADADPAAPAALDGDDTPDAAPVAPESPSVPDISDADRAELETLRRERAEVQRAIAEQQRAESERYWSQEWDTIHADKAGREQRIWAEMPNSRDPEAFLRAELAKLDAWYQDEVRDYYGRQDQARWEHQARQAIPRYAAEVARDHGLPDEDIHTLAALSNPNDMHIVAARLRDARQAQRSAAAARLAANQVGSGSGRALSRTPKPGSDAHLVGLLTGRLS